MKRPFRDDMRNCLIAIIIGLCCAESAAALPTACTVSGYLLNASGSPAAQLNLKVTSVVKSGESFVVTPVGLTTDANGFVSFAVPRSSFVWISATALGLSAAGDVVITIPNSDSATLEVLAQSARLPISGLSPISGSNLTPGPWGPDLGIGLTGDTAEVPLLKSPETTPGLVRTLASRQVDMRGPSSRASRRITEALSARKTLGGAAQRQPNSIATADIVTSGSYRFQFAAMPNTNAQWMSAQTVGDASAADVNLAISATPNPGSARNNVVTSWGYNNNGDGSRVIASEPTLNYRFESFYSPNPGNEYMESHLQYESPTGKMLRPFGLQIDRNTDVTSVQIQSDGFSYIGPDSTQWVKFEPYGVYFYNRAVMASYFNNTAFIKQINAAGNYFVDVAYLDSSDRINLGNGGTDVVVSGDFYVGGTGGLKMTSVAGAELVLGALGGRGALLTGTEVGAHPTPPEANGWKLYAKDDGTDKTQLCVLFSSGPPQCFAKQP